jgi:hypothetical protein
MGQYTETFEDMLRNASEEQRFAAQQILVNPFGIYIIHGKN